MNRPAAPSREQRRLLIALMTAFSAISIAATTMYVPSVPGIAAAFGVSASAAQLTIPAYMAGLAVGQFLYGPLADRIGRRPIALFGVGLFSGASILCVFAPSIELLMLGRLVQALGSAACLVIARVALRDVLDREEAAQATAIVVAAISISPIVAPALGGVLEDRFGWQASFITVAALGAALWAFASWKMPETLPQKVTVGARGVALNFGRLLGNPGFLVFMGCNTATFAAMYLFNTAAPVLMIRALGVPPDTFGLLTGVLGLGMFAGSLLAARLSKRLGIERMLDLALLWVLTGYVAFAAWAIIFGPSVASVYVPVTFACIGLGLLYPNVSTGAISTAPMMAGTASALLGSIQVSGGAVGALTAARLPEGDEVTLALALVAVQGLAAVLWFSLRRHARPAR